MRTCALVGFADLPQPARPGHRRDLTGRSDAAAAGSAASEPSRRPGWSPPGPRASIARPASAAGPWLVRLPMR